MGQPPGPSSDGRTQRQVRFLSLEPTPAQPHTCCARTECRVCVALVQPPKPAAAAPAAATTASDDDDPSPQSPAPLTPPLLLPLPSAYHGCRPAAATTLDPPLLLLPLPSPSSPPPPPPPLSCCFCRRSFHRCRHCHRPTCSYSDIPVSVIHGAGRPPAHGSMCFMCSGVRKNHLSMALPLVKL